jgi:DNA-binding transcriptional ArsR family regulator
MSRRSRSRASTRRVGQAPVFAALGDKTRLLLVAKLCRGRRSSISQLTEGSRLTRQAITKHLRVLERAGIVHSLRAGRESLFEFDPRPVEEIKGYLDLVSAEWDQALARLKSFVEDQRRDRNSRGESP